MRVEFLQITLREKVVKIGAKVVAHARYTVFQMAEVAVPRDLFRRILAMDRRTATKAGRAMLNPQGYSPYETQVDGLPIWGMSAKNLPNRGHAWCQALDLIRPELEPEMVFGGVQLVCSKATLEYISYSSRKNSE